MARSIGRHGRLLLVPVKKRGRPSARHACGGDERRRPWESGTVRGRRRGRGGTRPDGEAARSGDPVMGRAGDEGEQARDTGGGVE